MAKLSTEDKEALKKAEKFFNKLVRECGFSRARWAIRRKLDRESERVRLKKEKKTVEARLNEIDKKLA